MTFRTKRAIKEALLFDTNIRRVSKGIVGLLNLAQ